MKPLLSDDISLLREMGWLHKDDPTDKMVEEKCPCESINSIHKGMPMKHCSRCGGSGTISRPMTVGEVLEDYKKAKEQKDLLLLWNSQIAKIISEQKDLPPEFAALINEHFWELT